MPEASHVLRVPRSDQEGSFILARVTSRDPDSKPLSAKVVATEGMAPYVLTLRHDRIQKYKGSNAPCSADEWEAILLFVLLGKGSVEHVDATATVTEESSVTITVRKRVQNITQRLGTLSLEYDGDEGIELFDWCGEAVQGRTEMQDALALATAGRATLEKAVEDLKAQLDEFLKAKDADETALLEKFCTLLNEKKVKIRMQQRLLASAEENIEKNDGNAAEIAAIKAEEESQPSLSPVKQKKTAAKTAAKSKIGAVSGRKKQQDKPAPFAPRRGAKRRAAPSDDEEEGEEGGDGDEESDDDAFEKTAGPSTATRRSGRQRSAATTTAVEDKEDDSTDDGETTGNDEDDATDGEPEPMDEDEKDAAPPPAAAPEAPPPRRNIAFGAPKPAAVPARPAAASASASALKNDQGSETESSDDEL